MSKKENNITQEGEMQAFQVAQLPVFVPEITLEQYAKAVGVTKRVAGNWWDRGYIPGRKVGKYVMINLIALAQEAMRDEFKLKSR